MIKALAIDCDIGEFNRLPAEVRVEIRETVAVLERIDRAKNVRRAAQGFARYFSGKRGFSSSSLLRKYYSWKSSSYDWRTLIDLTKTQETQSSLSADFIDFWKSLIDENQRKIKPAYRKLCRMWRNGEEIPSYGTWQNWFAKKNPFEILPKACPPDLPPGWTYRNLVRHKPIQAEITLTRRGVAQARLELPSVIGTRDGLRPLEWIVLDDWRSDFRVIAAGQATQLNGVLALDVSSALALRFGLRPALTRDNGTDEGIKRRDVKALVAGILQTYGYPKNYICNIICERGTATISPDDAAAIEEITAGHVKIHYTSMISGNLFGYPDRPVGNFLGKAWLESYFNLVHNEAAELPGQMGATYALSPGELHGRIDEAKQLIKAGASLPPEIRAKIALPFLDIYQAQDSMEIIFRRLNHRQDHVLEAFAEILEWREKELQEWRPAHELANVPTEMTPFLIYRKRKETPLERWHRLASGEEFCKLHPSCMPRILEEHRRVDVEKPGEISFEILGKKRVWRDLDNPALHVDAEFLAYYDAQDLDWIHLTDSRGCYVASLPEIKAVRRDDAAALKDAMSAKTRQLSALMQTVRKRNADRMSNRVIDIESNIAALKELDSQFVDATYEELEAHVLADPGGATPVAAAIHAVDQARAERSARHAAAAERISKASGNLSDLFPDQTETKDDFSGDELDQLW